jgi:isopenicillin-N N-acyltransferase-like protein
VSSFDRAGNVARDRPFAVISSLYMAPESIATNTRSQTRFPEIDVAGAPRELGQQIGEATRETLPSLVDHVLARMNQNRDIPLDTADVLKAADSYFATVEQYSVDMAEELRGIAEGSNMSPAQIMLINARGEVPHRIGGGSAPWEGCTTIAVEKERASAGVGLVGQNWDNDDEMRPFSLVIKRRPTGKPANMTWGQPGLIAYMGLNDAGLGVALNAIPGSMNVDGLPWYFTVRGVYEATDIASVNEAIDRMDRARPGNLGMITREGAVDFEVVAGKQRMVRGDDDGLMVHTNHCLHPDLTALNENTTLYGQTFDRKTRSHSILDTKTGKVGVDDVKAILSDHENHPTSICRHPNDHPESGSDRSVVSMIAEPDAGRMHVTNGNPCENPYEVYELN